MNIDNYVSGVTASITNQTLKHSITPSIVGGAFTDLVALTPNIQTVNTYANMLTGGTPTISTAIYRVKSDENKGYSNTLYLWYPDGKRIWIAATEDN